MKFSRLGIIAATIAVTLLCTPLFSAAEESKGWEFLASPYVWMTAIDGDVTINHQSADMNIGFDDILDNLEFSGMFHMEAKKGRFGFFLETNYLKVSADDDLGALDDTDLDFEQESWIVDFGCYYRIGEWGTERPMTLDILCGGRYWNISTKLDEYNHLTGKSHDVKSDRDLLDPTVGLRFSSYLSDRFRINLKADIGGFDISDNSSKLSWQVIGLIGYDISKKTSLYAGYRIIDLDCEKGSFELDMTFHGPVVGLAFKFGGGK